jgi:hypothetical protein
MMLLHAEFLTVLREPPTRNINLGRGAAAQLQHPNQAFLVVVTGTLTSHRTERGTQTCVYKSLF